MATAKNEILTAVEVNVSTGEVITRNLTDAEIAELNLLKQQNLDFENANAAKTAARISALEKLAELGLTEEEVAAL